MDAEALCFALAWTRVPGKLLPCCRSARFPKFNGSPVDGVHELPLWGELGQVPGSGVTDPSLGAERHDGVGVHLAFGGGDEAHAGAGEDVESEIAAPFGPFVCLLG